ncbi:MAG TPA: hypothetical protein VNS32_12015, partial [Flavisolibacter sp.]|nr:hypothetical protein [Flavisolibacter sp.]
IWPARIMIICIWAALNGLGLLTGGLFRLFQISFSIWFLYGTTALFFIGIIIFPSRERKQEYRNFYFAHKRSDLILVFSTYLMLIWMGNNMNSYFYSTGNVYAASGITLPGKEERPSLKPSLKNILYGLVKKFTGRYKLHGKMKERAKAIRKQYQELSQAGKVILIILSVIVALFLMGLLIGLSCSISCSGDDGLAILVFLLGTFLIVFLLIKLIHRIIHGPKKSKTEPTVSPTTSV